MRTMLTFLAVAVMVSSACKQSPKSPSIDVEGLASTYAELLVLNERYSLSKDSISSQQYAAQYQEILQKHHLTKDEYTAQFQTVSASTGLYQQLCDRALTKLQQMRSNPDTLRTKSRS